MSLYSTTIVTCAAIVGVQLGQGLKASSRPVSRAKHTMPRQPLRKNHYVRNALLANLNVEGFDVKTLTQRMCDTRLQTAVPMSINGLNLRANQRPTTAHSFSRHGTTKNALTVHVTCFNSQTGFLPMFESQAVRKGSINFEMLR